MLCQRRNSTQLMVVLFVLFLVYVFVSFYLIHKTNSSHKLTEKDTEDFNFVISSSKKHNTGIMCNEHKNFVFIKCMKCATETLGTVFRRFGYVRNLTFVAPIGNKIYLGWPFQMTECDYRPSKRPFNIIMEHSIYNKTVMEKLMPSDTSFITMIREPYSHFKSVFSYFNLKTITKITSNDPFTEYLHNLEKYETIYKSHAASPTRYCIPDNFSVTKNLLSHCIGMPLGFPPGRENITSNDRAVEKYIKQIEKDFTLVMIMEYFHESLILLRRLFCWSFKDIIYWNANVAKYPKKNEQPPKENVSIYRKWSAVDYKLYDHFNKTFWRKIHEQSTDFFDEVKIFDIVQEKAIKYCTKPASEKLVFSRTAWNEPFELTVKDCDMLKQYLLKPIQKRHDEVEHNPIPPTRNPTDPYKPLC